LARRERELQVDGPGLNEEVEVIDEKEFGALLNGDGESILGDRGRLRQAEGQSGSSSTFLSSLRRGRLSQATLKITKAKVIKVSEKTSPEDEFVEYMVSLEILEFEARRPNRQTISYAGSDLGDFKYLKVEWPALISQSDDEQEALIAGPLAYTGGQRNRIYSEELNRANEENPTREPRALDLTRNLPNFFSSDSNPIVRSFESSRGRGLAGFITDLKMDWGDSTWEIDPGSRAPIMMKLSMTFNPIHDIPMGLDSDGAMRSVAYGVGRHSRSIGRDPYDD
jgi:hypothetical protein